MDAKHEKICQEQLRFFFPVYIRNFLSHRRQKLSDAREKKILIVQLPQRPNFSDIFDLCLYWVSVVRGLRQFFIHIQNFQASVDRKFWM